MPQFDKLSFFTQVFWLILIFFSFYILLLKVFIPNLSLIVKTRINKLKIEKNSIYNLKNLDYETFIDHKMQVLRDFGTVNKKSTIYWFDNITKNLNEKELVGNNNFYVKNMFNIFSKKLLLNKLF